MHHLKNDSLLPADGEVATVPGVEPGTAIRIRRLCGDGQVLLEQIRYSRSAGWYVQKSFSVPEALLDSVMRGMRKAHCLAPQRQTFAPQTNTTLRLKLD